MKSLAGWARKLFIDEKGGVMIIVAFLLFFVFLGMVAISVDVGYLYLQRRHQQSTADAAALAAAWELPWDNASIETTAIDYVLTNNIDDADIEVSPPGGDIRKVKVEITKNYPLFFALAPPIRQPDADVYAMAVATMDLPGLDLIPFNITSYFDPDDDTYDIIGHEYRYHDYPSLNLPVYRTDDVNDKPKKDEHFQLVNGPHEIWGDWGNNISEFAAVLLEIVPTGIVFWAEGQTGNFQLADMNAFLKDPIMSDQKQAQYVLGSGLDFLFCLDANKTRKGLQGQVASVESSPSDEEGMKLSERIEQDEVFFLILLKPATGSIVHGSNNTYGIDDFLIGVVEDLVLENTQPFTVTGTLVDVIDCDGDMNPASEYVNVYLIE